MPRAPRPFQAPGLDLPTRLATSLAQGIQKELAIGILEKNILVVVAAAHDVVNGAWILNESHLSILRTINDPLTIGRKGWSGKA